MARKKQSNIITYDFEECPVEVTSQFLYEVTTYEVFPKRVDLLSTKFYTSDKLLKVENFKTLKKTKNYSIEVEVTLLGVPFEFIKENNLPIYDSKKYEKRTRRNTRRIIHRRK